MFALIVGIDNYSHVPKLKGAVADADRFKSFLTNEVKVQTDRIISLRNREATREGIVSAFRALWECESIQHADPVLIYYAGHGCKMPQPKDWEVGDHEMIQAICPCDMKRQDSSSKAIYPIPDCTIAVWLNLISYKKGHNITVILDCCHSAGVTQVPEEGTRYLDFDGEFPPALEKEFTDALEISGGVPKNYVNQHSRSHVLLAACSSTESAKEVDGQGLFTTELLRALKEEPETHQLSFLEFTGRLQTLTRKNKIIQTPQCYGHFKDRVLFSNLLKLGSETFPASWDYETEAYRIEAGLIHSVDTGSLFDMYETAAIGTIIRKPLCTLTVRRVHPFHAIATINEANVRLSGMPRVVRQVRSGNPLKVHLTSAFLAIVDQDKVLRLHDLRRKVKVERVAASADFIIDIEGEKEAVFTTNLKAITAHGFTRLPKPVRADAENVSRVLLAASRWKQHLEISCDYPLANKIHAEFLRLERTLDLTSPVFSVFNPMGKPLNDGNDLVHVNINRTYRNYYGMKITNNTPKNLYFSVMAFDIDDLDITSASRFSRSTGDADPDLYSMKSLPIGYGNGENLPFAFHYPRSEINVTILKMYFTTSPMDMKWLEQATPFTVSHDRALWNEETVWRRLNTSTSLAGFTKTIRIVQHRR